MAKEADTPTTPRKPSTGLWILAIAIMVCAGTAATIKYTRHYIFPKRFAVVEPGQVYRAGYCEPGPLARVISDNHIRTILTLLEDQADSKEQQAEEAIVKEKGVRVIRIAMPGDGRADFALLDQAAAVIAEPANHPILVHCYAGVNRTGASIAAWRMKYCGWTCDQALQEAQDRGMSRQFNADLFEHIRRYAARINPASGPTS